MALKTIDLGTSPNKGDGDPLRTAFTKINDNFTEVYALLGADEVDTDDVIAPMLVHNNHTNVTVTRDDDADQIIFTVDQAVTDLQGSVFGDDSTLLVDGVNSKITGEVTGTISSTNWMASSDNYLTIANGGSTGPGPIQIVASANLDLSAGAGQVINANRNIVAAGGVTGDLTGNVSGNVTGNVTGDVNGSVFADDSTLLVDGVNSIIPKAVVEDSTNWDTAFAWGDHSAAGYADGTNEANWDTAFSWGDHAAAGYLTSETDSQTLSLVGTDLSITNGNTVDLSGFLTSYTETDPVVGAITGIVKADGAGNITAAVAGTDYLTSVAFADLTATPTTIAGYGITDAFDGTYASLSGSPTALSDFSNDLDYAPIVSGAIQANGLPSGTTFTDTLTLPVLTAEPSSPVNGMVAVADGTSWDPMLNAAQTMVVYLAGAWRQIAQGGV